MDPDENYGIQSISTPPSEIEQPDSENMTEKRSERKVDIENQSS